MLIGNDINKAKEFLQQGKLIAIPTETVYGLAANAYNEGAILSIYKAKNRPAFNPLILHVPYASEAKKLAAYFPDKAQQLAETFWPGPLTLVLPKKNMVSDIITAGQNTVAIRVPNHTTTLQLLRQIDFPLAAPSANPSGYISPTTAQHVAQQLANQVAYILDGGPCTVGLESTILKIENDEVYVLRYGGLSIEHIEAQIGKVLPYHASSTIESPGMMTSHYAPHKKVIIGNIEANISYYKNEAIGILSFQKKYSGNNIVQQFQLSENGQIDEAAKNIFSMMRLLDASQATIILAELLPEQGLGKAINDRLARAAVER